MKLALGTVQFGLDYGISNQQGQVSQNQVSDILQQAQALGIDTLDCAGAYGNSEKVLGELNASESFKLISKIPALTKDQHSITPFVEESLLNLHCSTLDTLLFHQADNLLNHPEKAKLYAQLALLKEQQQVNNIGVSVYSPEQLMPIIHHYPIDTAQVPINVFDQRFISTDIIELCTKKGVKLHARSLFLQGLLFIEHTQLPPYFKQYRDKLNAFDELAKYLSCTKLTLALALLAQDLPETTAHQTDFSVIEKMVVGVCNTEQLTEIVNAYQQAKALSVARHELRLLADTRLDFINPSLWPL
jgi:aryl-alcohol dehydrogenase-like predicted oxidoreductase